MSNQAKPYEELSEFNRENFPSSSSSSSSLDYPVAQGVASLVYGVIWGDGSYQNSASGGGGAPLTVQDGTVTVSNVTDINVTNGTLTDNGGGSVSIATGGGGGGGVTNPMTADLDGGGYSISNVGTFSGLIGNFGEVTTEAINDSAAVIYRNKGAVAAGNYYYVGELPVMTDAEASCIVVSRCLDAGFKQTTVIHVSMFNGKAHLNLISNALESDTPIFTLCSAGFDGLGSGGFLFYCNHPSTTWEYRVYRQQDDKGTGTYPASGFFNFAPGGAVSTVGWNVVFAELDTSVHASAAVSGSFSAKTSLTSATLQTDTAVATVSLSSARVNTDELNNNGGTGLIDVLSPIRMNNNDIQSAGIVGAAGYYISAPGVLPIGSPTGPLYVDTVNQRVGIGEPNPQEDLHVAGNIQLDTNAPAKIVMYDPVGGHEHAEITATGAGANGGQLELKTKEDGGTVNTRMTIFEDGRVSVTNRIENVSNPINAQDAATKDYVDSSVPTGFVTNPMTADLDGGQFNVTNIDRLTVQNATGSTFDADAATNIVNIFDAANTSAVEVDANAYAVRVKDSAGSNQCSLLGNTGTATHSGNCVDQFGGISAQPKLTGGFPRAGNNLIMGKYGWDDSGPSPATFALGRANDTGYYGGGGNIYCNAVRENIWYNQATSSSAYTFPYTPGFQGNSPLRQYYNGADLKNVLMNPGNAGGQYQEFRLPPITEAMLGMSITVTRLRLNETFYPGLNAAGIPRYKAAVVVAAAGTDYIAGPDSIFVSGGGLLTGGLAIDPHRVITTLTTPSPYVGVNSITVVATQCGDGQNVNAPNPEYVWHCTNETPSVIPMLIATMITPQTIYDATNSNLFFDQAEANTDGIWNGGSTNTFTIQTPGVYLVTACCDWSSTMDVRADLWIVQSVGGTVARDIRYGTVEYNNITYTYKFAAGDTLSVWVYQDNASTYTRTANVRLSVMWIG